MKRLLMEEAGNGAADGGSGGGGGAGDGSSGQGTANNGGQGSGEGQGGSHGATLLSSQGNGTSEASTNGSAAAPVAVGTQGPWYANLYGADGKLDKKAFDRLPDHLKGHKDTFAKYDSVEALLGGMGNLANLAGKKGLAPLPENAPPEVKAERAALMRTLNAVPEKPEGYGFTRPTDYPAEFWNDKYASGVSAILHKHNAPPALAKELLAHDVAIAKGNLATRQQSEDQQMANEHAELKKAFGADFATKTDLAIRAARTLGMDPTTDPLFKSHKMVVAMARIGEMISEDRLVSSDGKAGDGMTDRQKARDVVTNEANPLYKAYHNAEDPGHAEALRTVEMFNKRAAAAASKKK